MKTVKIFLTAVCSSMALLSAATNIGGVLSANTTLTYASSPYIVTSNIMVMPGVRLTIEPGVEMKFENDRYLAVMGECQALGKPDSMIIMTRASTSGIVMFEGWYGIKVDSSAVDFDSLTQAGTIFNYVKFDGYRTNGAPSPALIYGERVNIRISNCEFYNGSGGNAVYLVKTQSHILRNKFANTNHPNGAFYAFVVAENTDSTKPAYIIGNEFMNGPNVLSGGVVVLWNTIFSENYVHDIVNNVAVSVLGRSAVTNNLFVNDSVPLGTHHVPNQNLANDITIRCNLFRGNYANIRLGCATEVTAEYNYFMGTRGPRYVTGDKNCTRPAGLYGTVDFRNNYWTTADTSVVDTLIYDFNEDFSTKVVVSFTPVLTDSNPVCPPAISLGVVEHVPAHAVILVYPNPFAQSCTIRLDPSVQNAGGLLQMRIYNVTGQEVGTLRLDASEVLLEKASLGGSGVFYYRVLKGDAELQKGKLIAY